MPVTLTWVYGWRWPCRFLYPVLFLYLRIEIFGRLTAARISAVTWYFASSPAALTTLSPATTSSAGNVPVSPTFPASLSTVSTSSTATFSCLPPQRTIAYTRNPSGTSPQARGEVLMLLSGNNAESCGPGGPRVGLRRKSKGALCTRRTPRVPDALTPTRTERPDPLRR